MNVINSQTLLIFYTYSFLLRTITLWFSKPCSLDSFRNREAGSCGNNVESQLQSPYSARKTLTQFLFDSKD